MTNGNYRLVVFDWEGTLGEDPCGQVLNVLELQARRLQFGEIDRCLARQHAPLGLALAVNKVFPHLLLHQQEQLLNAVQESLTAESMEHLLIPGARNIVEKIHHAGFALAIATNKGAQALQRVLQQTGMDVFFTVTRAAGQAPPKPCPQMLEEIMDTIGVSASETLMIGDSAVDIEMASSAGVDSIGVDFYCTQTQELRAAGARDVFNDYQHVAHYLHLSGDAYL